MPTAVRPNAIIDGNSILDKVSADDGDGSELDIDDDAMLIGWLAGGAIMFAAVVGLGLYMFRDGSKKPFSFEKVDEGQ